MFLAIAVLSVGVLGLTRYRLEQAAEHAVVATNNVQGARSALLRAEVELAGGPERSTSTSGALAELDNAAVRLSDLLEGRSALFAFEAEGLRDSPVAAALVDSLTTGVQELRALLAGPVTGRSAVDVDLRFGALRSSAAELERQVHQLVEARLTAEGRTQRSLLVAWGVFLALTGVAIELLRRARLRAIAQSKVARAERQAAVEELGETERRLESLRTLMDAGLLLVDADGRVLEMSRWWGRHIGMIEEEWVGRPWWDAFHDQERHRLIDLWDDKSRRRSAFALEARGRGGETGADVWMSGRWRPVADEDGRPDGTWVGTFLDVTQARSVETQLHQAQKLEAVGRMTSGIAHDFNNLLAVILTNAELLRDASIDTPEERLELVEDIERSAASGRELVAGLMRFSRREELHLRTHDLSEVVRAALRMASKLLHEGIEVVTDLPEPGPIVHADARALQQVLLNLATNARDAMPDGGLLIVSVDRVDADESFTEDRPWIQQGHFGRFSVTDTGMGMDRETQDRIFEPFFSTKAEGFGTGLGLASSHGLVRQHGGHIHVYSEPGQGTTFRVYLPMAAEARDTASPHADASEEGEPPSAAVGGTSPGPDPDLAEPPAAVAGRHGLRVLLVEDDPALRTTAERVLVRLGHQVLAVDDATSALGAVRGSGTPWDLVISDISMDRIDGIELVRLSREEGFEIPFVLTSGRHVSQLLAGSPLPDHVTFLQKPWSVDALEQAIHEARRRA